MKKIFKKAQSEYEKKQWEEYFYGLVCDLALSEVSGYDGTTFMRLREEYKSMEM